MTTTTIDNYHENNMSTFSTTITRTKNVSSSPIVEQRRGSLAQMMSMTTTSSLQQNPNTLFNTTITKSSTPSSSSSSAVKETIAIDDPMDQDAVMDFLSPDRLPTSGATSPPVITNRRRSSSCNMLTSIHSSSMNTSTGFEVHTLYKIKRSRSARKLNHFFGEQTPDDICIAEIRREGLKALLQSKIPVCYFLYHLLQEISSENLVCIFIFIYLFWHMHHAYASCLKMIIIYNNTFLCYQYIKSICAVLFH